MFHVELEGSFSIGLPARSGPTLSPPRGEVASSTSLWGRNIASLRRLTWPGGLRKSPARNEPVVAYSSSLEEEASVLAMTT